MEYSQWQYIVLVQFSLFVAQIAMYAYYVRYTVQLETGQCALHCQAIVVKLPTIFIPNKVKQNYLLKDIFHGDEQFSEINKETSVTI